MFFWEPYRKLLWESTPPHVSRLVPANGELVGAITEAQAVFDEPMSAATLAEGLQLWAAGTDGLTATEDDVRVDSATSYREATNTAFLSF